LQSISANALAPLIHKTAGFFLIEREVLQSTGDFRSAREVDELWDDVVARLTSGLNAALRNEVDPDSLLSVKELILSFIITVEVRINVNCYWIGFETLIFNQNSLSPTRQRHFTSLFSIYLIVMSDYSKNSLDATYLMSASLAFF
jgi:hypothetical protein